MGQSRGGKVESHGFWSTELGTGQVVPIRVLHFYCFQSSRVAAEVERIIVQKKITILAAHIELHHMCAAKMVIFFWTIMRSTSAATREDWKQ
jgi:hypothetical protein